MLTKVCVLVALASVASAHYFYNINLQQTSIDSKRFLKCIAKLGHDALAENMILLKHKNNGFIEVARLDSNGLILNETFLEEEGLFIDDIVGVHNLSQAGKHGVHPFMALHIRDMEEEGFMYGDYRCDLNYVIPSQHHARRVESSKLYKVGSHLKVHTQLQEFKEYMDEMIGKLSSINLRQMIWPEGEYSLLKPRYGCPKYDLAEWAEGTRRQVLESSFDTNKNENNTADHMPLDLFFKESNWFLSNMSYCTRPAYGGVAYWPYGTYCINRKSDACPEGFLDGSILFDDEDFAGGMNQKYGVLPDGVYNANTRFFYCCRKDKSPDEEVFLPIQEPFYLYRYQGKCQKVAGMKFTEDYIVFDTADFDSNGENIDEQTGEYPDSTINNIRLDLCYYEKDY